MQVAEALGEAAPHIQKGVHGAREARKEGKKKTKKQLENMDQSWSQMQKTLGKEITEEMQRNRISTNSCF